MGVETTISLSLIFSSISMIGVKLENFFSTMTGIARNNENSAQKIDENLKAILQSNERIGTLFRLHDDNVRRIESLEERANKHE